MILHDSAMEHLDRLRNNRPSMNAFVRREWLERNAEDDEQPQEEVQMVSQSLDDYPGDPHDVYVLI